MKNGSVFIVTLCLMTFACTSKSDSTVQEVKKQDSIDISTKRQNEEILNKVDKPGFECDYLGEIPPGTTPKLFAPNYISTQSDESCFEISSTGKEIIFNREGKIFLISWDDKKQEWNKQRELFTGGENSFSPNGKKIYFNSRIHFTGAKVALNVWISEKTESGWGVPNPFKDLLFEQTIHAPSVAASGNIYASGIVIVDLKNGQYSNLNKIIPETKGSHPFIAPDESYVIFDKPVSGRRDGDLFISFRNSDLNWGNPIHLGNQINTKKMETNAFVTPDGKYLFFTRQFDIYWAKADFIDESIKNNNKIPN